VVLVGGRTREGRAEFGKAIGRVPARRAPEAARRLLSLYQRERQGSEPFADFISRTGLSHLRSQLADLTVIPPFDQQPEMYRDLGAEDEVFTAEVGVGECAS
jgi:sulfite reductase (ferredoxin)